MHKTLFCCLFIVISSTITILNKYPHDTTCYTQGFEFISETQLVESCGLYGKSQIIIHQLDKQRKQIAPLNRKQLPNEVFGEGVTLFNGKYYVLTWREKRVFLLNSNLQQERELRLSRQGWGLTNNSTHLFLSDGTSNIFILDSNMN
jgi:glutamine cyclotransferase